MTNSGRIFDDGKTNFDRETNIHYGVLPQYAVSSWALDDIVMNGTDVIYEESREEFKGELLEALKEVLNNNYLEDDFDDDELSEMIDPIMERWNDSYMNDYHEWDYSDDDGYHVTMGSDGDIFILKSPFYTYADYCSPCAPNAGYLRDVRDESDGIRTYCLGFDWFEKEYAEAPYDVIYRVDTDEPVKKSIESEDEIVDNPVEKPVEDEGDSVNEPVERPIKEE